MKRYIELLERRLGWLSRPFRPFSVWPIYGFTISPFCRFNVSTVLRETVSSFRNRTRFENSAFHFEGRAKVPRMRIVSSDLFSHAKGSLLATIC